MKRGFDLPALDEGEKEKGEGRFWMKPGTTRRIAFVDDVPLVLYEHEIFNGETVERFVCTEDEKCPMCIAKVKRNLVGLFEIIDLDGFKGRDGHIHGAGRHLWLAAKKRVLKRLKLKHEKLKGLKGKIFEVSRIDDEYSSSCGDEFEYTGETLQSVEKRFPEEIKPDVNGMIAFLRTMKKNVDEENEDDSGELPF